ncbi:MAG: hypothetical protein AAFX99_31150, partial [Myxococcota bacterium]
TALIDTGHAVVEYHTFLRAAHEAVSGMTHGRKLAASLVEGTTGLPVVDADGQTQTSSAPDWDNAQDSGDGTVHVPSTQVYEANMGMSASDNALAQAFGVQSGWQGRLGPMVSEYDVIAAGWKKLLQTVAGKGYNA